MDGAGLGRKRIELENLSRWSECRNLRKPFGRKGIELENLSRWAECRNLRKLFGREGIDLENKTPNTFYCIRRLLLFDISD